jgi:hypothetical protein
MGTVATLGTLLAPKEAWSRPSHAWNRFKLRYAPQGS